MFRNTLLVWAVFLVVCVPMVTADDWPQWRGPQRDGEWKESGLLQEFDGPELPIQWRMPISSGYSGPTVAEGRVYVMDRQVKPRQVERVLCFRESDGKSLWTHTYDCKYVGISYEAGPRTSVSVDDDRAYALGTMGHLFCLRANDGKVLWQRDLNADYKVQFEALIWGVSASPLVDGDLLIVQVGGEKPDSCLVAFDKLTGEERWRSLSDRPSYSSPIIIEQAGQRVLVCWTGDSMAGLNPQTGQVLWQEPFAPRNMVLAVSTPVVDQDRLFVTGFYDGSLMLKLGQDEPQVEKVWRRIGQSERQTDALHSIISTPVLDGDYIYGVDSYGELRCLEAATGDRVWEDKTAVPNVRWGTIHFVKNGDRYFLFNEKGELIIARLSPKGYDEISRTQLIAPTTAQLGQRGGVCWSHPAYANRHVFIRNDEEIVCADLSAK
ncbi:MAG: PQQ-binding-like beta-propeller repeat protein [Pirellulales bacterium]